jgi:hypothetical protein
MSVTPPRIVAAIRRMLDAGHSLRETATALGINRETVLMQTETKRRAHLWELASAALDWIEARHPHEDCEPAAQLAGELGFVCRYHPEAKLEDDLVDPEGCLLCKRDAHIRRHARKHMRAGADALARLAQERGIEIEDAS